MSVVDLFGNVTWFFEDASTALNVVVPTAMTLPLQLFIVLAASFEISKYSSCIMWSSTLVSIISRKVP